jgi:phosphoribosylpyrophosphate synthetase
VVDDEVAAGGTIFNATEFPLERGARSVSAAITHIHDRRSVSELFS